MSLVVSPTSAPYLSCLRRFHTLAVRKQYPRTQQQQNDNLIFSNAVHACLKSLYDPRTLGTLPHSNQLDFYLRQAFLRAGYANCVDMEHDLKRARRIIKAYFSQCDISEDDCTTGVEVASTFDVVAGETKYTMTARMDRVLLMPDKAVAIDYKLSIFRRLPDSDSILIYLCALRSLYPDARRYEFWVESLCDSEENPVERIVFTGEEYKGQIHNLSAKVRRYFAAEEYPSEPGDHCLYCQIRDTCKSEEKTAMSEDDLDF